MTARPESQPVTRPRVGALQRASNGVETLGRGVDWHDPRTWVDFIAGPGGPATLVFVVCSAAFLWGWLTLGPWGWVDAWGLSGAALAQGRWWTIGSHMITHGGLAHIIMNTTALMGLGAFVTARMASGLRGWWGRFFGLFIVSGLCGAGLYLALHLTSAVPMVGASGAICGLWGAAARVGPDGRIVPLRSRPVWLQVQSFAIMNLVLGVLLYISATTAGQAGGLAWEAHLGGFLFGLLAMPLLAPAEPPARFRRLFLPKSGIPAFEDASEPTEPPADQPPTPAAPSTPGRSPAAP